VGESIGLSAGKTGLHRRHVPKDDPGIVVAMDDFAFQVNVVAMVRVRAADKNECARGRSHNPWSARFYRNRAGQ
jgi:hypothetical protein